MIKVHTAPAIAICSLGKTSVAHIDFSSFPLFFLVIEIVPLAPISRQRHRKQYSNTHDILSTLWQFVQKDNSKREILIT